MLQTYFGCSASLALSIASSTMSLVLSITLAALSFAWSIFPFGLTETPICFTFGFQVLVAGENPPRPTISVNRGRNLVR
jgi:hypothetical protein